MAGQISRPPFDLTTARAVETIPGPGALPGGCQYEPKWDGWRAQIVLTQGSVKVWSRQNKDLTRWFPELPVPLTDQIHEDCILDGEIVIWRNDRLDFDALQQRLGTGPARAKSLATEAPASFVAFDLLYLMGQDLRGYRLRHRRALLEQLAEDFAPPLQISPATTDFEEAREWFRDLPDVGIEGLVVKGLDQPAYQGRGSQRSWQKVKHRDSLDVVCAAVIGPQAKPVSLVIGLPIDGRLRIVGRSAQLTAASARSLGALLRAPKGGHPWPPVISPRTLDRFTNDDRPVNLTLVEPLVVEVSADVAWSGISLRHSVRFLRARPDLPPSAVKAPARRDAGRK